MIVARSLAGISYEPLSVVTVGTFDGVHVGHQSIIGEARSRANNLGGRVVVITFEPHPREILSQEPVKLLLSLEERLEALERLGIDCVLVLQFTYEFSRQSSRDFYQRYVVQGVGVREVIVGYDHMFGRDREAGVDEVRRMGEEFGFRSISVGPVSVNGEVASSSKIREALGRGEVERAEKFLGRPYTMKGTVVRGDGRGASLGFPTANLLPAFAKKLVPGPGVYCVSVVVADRLFNGMLNIGTRPTFNGGTGSQSIEVHLFDFSGSLYDMPLQVGFLKRLRSEQKFSSKEELIQQLHRDREESLQFLASVDAASHTHP